MAFPSPVGDVKIVSQLVLSCLLCWHSKKVLFLLIERDSFQRIWRIFRCQKLTKKTVEPMGLFPNTKMLAKQKIRAFRLKKWLDVIQISTSSYWWPTWHQVVVFLVHRVKTISEAPDENIAQKWAIIPFFFMFESPRRGKQARNFTTNVPKILDLKSSSEQIFSKNWRGCPWQYGSSVLDL